MSAGSLPGPLIKTQTTSSSENIRSVLQDLDNKQIFIPEYQRDSDQWDREKKSLFIESILNNLTIPAFFLSPAAEEGKKEVVDGQQRLTTLKEFASDRLTLVESDEAPFLGELSVHYAGKKFSQLSSAFRQAFESYKLTIIQLPYNIDETLRLEIFRRINEGGTPLTPQDIRLAYYGQCKPVTFIRLCGIYDKTRQGSIRMIESANVRYGLGWPWNKQSEDAQQEWKDWWEGRQRSVGQTASEMFLWFLIAKYYKEIDEILSNKGYLAANFKMTFAGTTEQVADVTCAQLKSEANSTDPKRNKLCSTEEMIDELFPNFANWFYVLRQRLPSVGVDRYRRLAFLIAPLSEYTPDDLSDNQWGFVERFVTKPRDLARELGIEYPESKGKWSGNKGQKAQIKSVYDVAQVILSS